MKYRIRKKGDKYVVQKHERIGWKTRTLNPQQIWNYLECLDTKAKDVSNNEGKTDIKPQQKFIQSPLNEPKKDDENGTLTPEDMDLVLKDILR